MKVRRWLGSGARALLAASLVLAPLESCYRPELEECTLACGPNEECPDGQTCVQGFCARDRLICKTSPDDFHFAGIAGMAGRGGTTNGGTTNGGTTSAGGVSGSTTGGGTAGVEGPSGTGGSGDGSGGDGSGGDGSGGDPSEPGPVYLKPETPLRQEQFGFSVDIDGNRLAVGAHHPDSALPGGPGAVYVFVREGTSWRQEARLVSATSQSVSWFGHALSLSGNTLAIGQSHHDPGRTGVVHVFVFSAGEWQHEALLQPADRGAGDVFGASLVLVGDTLLVGAPLEDGAGNAHENTGAAYVFTRTDQTWIERATLRALNPATTFQFGAAIAMHGTRVAIGAPGNPSLPGAVHVFTGSGSTWQHEQEIQGVDLDDYFGGTVALSASHLVIGAVQEDGDGSSVDDDSLGSAGAAYVYARVGTEWQLERYLKPRSPLAGANFGSAVALLGNTLLVGSLRETHLGLLRAGAVHTFERGVSNWIEGPLLVAPNPGAEDRFGNAVALSDEFIVVGAKLEESDGSSPADDSLPEAGAVYLWNR